MNCFTDSQQEKLEDLFREKGVWRVYIASWRVGHSGCKLNAATGLAAALVIFGFAFRVESIKHLADQQLALATLLFPLFISQLGFLLAGFTFFATVADRSLFCAMADRQFGESGLSYLKYNLLIFIKILIEYLLFSLVCLALIVLLNDAMGIRVVISKLLAHSLIVKRLAAAGGTGVFIGFAVYLLMQLAAFIYNIYHVVITSVRWELEKYYNEQNRNGA